MKNRIKLLAASLWLAASPLVPLRVYAERTNSDKERENVVWVNPMDRYGMVWASNLADSVMHILEREYVPFVFIEIPTMAGSLCNRYIQGDPEAEKVYLKNCSGGSGLPFEGEDVFVDLLHRLKRYNEKGEKKVRLWGYDMSVGPGSWVDELKHISAYKETTIPDSLERYCLDEEINIYAQAARTCKMMQKEKKRLKRLLGEEYEPWLRYMQARSKRETAPYNDRYDADALASLILSDYRWLDQRLKGRKIIICSHNVGQRIQAQNK